MGSRRLDRIEEGLVDRMTLERRYAAIADAFSACRDGDEYAAWALEAIGLGDSPHHRHTNALLGRLTKDGPDNEENRRLAYECARRSGLALAVNIDLGRFIEEVGDHRRLLSVQVELLEARARLLLQEGDASASAAFSAAKNSAVSSLYDLRVLKGPRVEGIALAVRGMADDLFGGRPFLTRENERGLAGLVEYIKPKLECWSTLTIDGEELFAMDSWEEDVASYAAYYRGQMEDEANAAAKKDIHRQHDDILGLMRGQLAERSRAVKCVEDVLDESLAGS